jgi:syntaxin 6
MHPLFQIGGQEMGERKQFITTTTKQVSDIRTHLSSSESKAKVAAGARKALLGGGGGASSRYAKLESEIASSNDEFIQDQGQKQELIMREQDTQLEEVASTMGALKEMGAMIGDELEDQNRLLDEIDEEMDSTSEKLKRTIAKVDTVLAISKDGKQSCAICLLVIVLIILIIVWAK